MESNVNNVSNELSSVLCPRCHNKLIRVFNSRTTCKTIKSDNIKDHMKHMKNLMEKCEEEGSESSCSINGPKYKIIYTGKHFTKPYSDRLYEYGYYGINRCPVGVMIGYSEIDILSRALFTNRMIYTACVANHIEPEEIYDWLKQNQGPDSSKLLGYDLSIEQVKHTDLWVGIFVTSGWSTQPVHYDISKVAGPSWNSKIDYTINKRSYYNEAISNTHSSLLYAHGSDNKTSVNLPDTIKFCDLSRFHYYRVINAKTKTGVPVKIKVTHEGNDIVHANRITKQLDKFNFPKRFWIIDEKSFCGTEVVQKGDIVL